MNYYGMPNVYPQGPSMNPNGYNDMDCIIQPSVGVGGLYLGNLSAANNIDALMKNGIRCILTAAVEANVSHDKDSIPYHVKLPAVDHENYSLEPFFDQAADYIDQHLRITNVLVHCMAGVSRSVSLVMAYLMKYRSMTLQDSLNYIRSRRPVANPNSGFLQQLKSYYISMKTYGRSPRHDHHHRNTNGHSPNPRPYSPNPNMPNTTPYMYGLDNRNGGLRGSGTNDQMYPYAPTGGQIYPNMPGYDNYGGDLRGSYAQSNQAQYAANLSKSWAPNFNGY